jgi:predicted TIM-barrel enzyme
MKKIILLTILMATQILAQAQEFELGIKLGVNSGKSQLKDLQNYSLNADAAAKIHGGAYARLKVWAVGLYIQPECLITTRASDLQISGSNLSTNSTIKDVTVKHSSLYADVPVLIGMKFIKLFRVYAGPNFQFLLNQDTEIPTEANLVKKFDLKSNTTGIIIGAGVDVWRLRGDLRWDYSNNLGSNIQFNGTEPTLKSSMISFQISYKIFGVL